MINNKYITKRPLLYKTKWFLFTELINFLWNNNLHYYVFAQVKLNKIVTLKDWIESSIENNELIDKKQIDFVISYYYWNIVWLIELDDNGIDENTLWDSDILKLDN